MGAGRATIHNYGLRTPDEMKFIPSPPRMGKDNFIVRGAPTGQAARRLDGYAEMDTRLSQVMAKAIFI